jgi:hypothetical protein
MPVLDASKGIQDRVLLIAGAQAPASWGYCTGSHSTTECDVSGLETAESEGRNVP